MTHQCKRIAEGVECGDAAVFLCIVSRRDDLLAEVLPLCERCARVTLDNLAEADDGTVTFQVLEDVFIDLPSVFLGNRGMCNTCGGAPSSGMLSIGIGWMIVEFEVCESCGKKFFPPGQSGAVVTFGREVPQA